MTNPNQQNRAPQQIQAENAPNVVTGTFSIQVQSIDVLFNLGATHSFISVKRVEVLRLVLTRKSSVLSMILPNWKTVMCEELYEDCPIRMYEHEFLTDLYRFELANFGVILGMDWLANHQTQIECPRSKITLQGPNGGKVVHKRKGPRASC